MRALGTLFYIFIVSIGSAFGATVDLFDGITNPLFAATPGNCPTSWACGGSPAPGFASYAPAPAHYAGGSPFSTSAYSPTVLSGSGTIRQLTSLTWVAGNTYLLNLWAGLPKTEPDGTTPVVGWAQTARLYLTASDAEQVAAFDIPNPGKNGFAANPISFTLPSNSPFAGKKISLLIFVSATQNYSANFAITPACSSLVTNALTGPTIVDTTGVRASFTPNGGYTLAQAAQICGFIDFDWQQTITSWPRPSPLLQVGNPTPLSAPPSFLDPPLRGYTYELTKKDKNNQLLYPNGDNSYPFYYDPRTGELQSQKTSATTLSFFDAPGDSCLFGGSGGGCGGLTALRGKILAFTTRLVGVFGLFPGINAQDLGVGFTWTSSFNGTAGGVSITKNDLPTDPGSGTGGVAIIAVQRTTNYGGIPAVPAAPQTLAAGFACNGTYSGTFTGTILVSPGQKCTFINGTITGDVQAIGGQLVLSGVLVTGGVQIHGGVVFSIDAFTTINGDLEIYNFPVSTAQNQVCSTTVEGNLRFHDNGTPVQIGSASASSCGGNVVGGNIEVNNNTASTAIFANTITGNLQCTGNGVITGSGNTATLKQGQCSSF